MSSKTKTQVIIAGKIYTVSGYESEEYLQKVAAYLNSKISEFKTADGYSRMSPEMRGILLNLNTVDDYFKMQKKVEELEKETAAKDREVYELKHELITSKIRLESTEKEVSSLQERLTTEEKKTIQLEAQLKSQGK